MSHQHLSQDISPAAIKKAVVATTLQKPMTVYPAAAGILGGIYTLLFGANPFGLTVLIAGSGLTLANWMFEYYAKGNQHANQFVTQFRKQLERRRIFALQQLEEELQQNGHEDALLQVQLFRQKYGNFQSVLEKRLDTTELTYNRYLSIAEQVFLNGLNNLEDTSVILKSVSTIDTVRIQQELITLTANSPDTSEAKASELRTRLALHESQLTRVSELLLENEKALTQLDQAAATIANINTKQGHAMLDMESAMEELKRLTSKADHYSNKQ